jgi:hypothetical protein
MINIVFTASIVKIDKGCYIARADELAIASGQASTTRGAIRQLKNAVLARLRAAAESGTLTEFLENAGYSTDLIAFKNANLRSYTFNSDTVSVQLPRQLPALNRVRRDATGEERNGDAIE